jgi:pimeloyl-ACP methyl ester carboxylesterase
MQKIKSLVLCCIIIAAAFCQCLAVHLAAADNTTDNSESNDLSDAHDPAQCAQFQTNENYFFDDYETHDYNGGFLNLHFRLRQPYNDGRQWTDSGFYIYDQSCAQEYQHISSPHIAIDAGDQLYSMRFSSATHYDIWNDEMDIRETCAGCSGDINTVLSSTGVQASSISFYGVIDGSLTMHSASYSILSPTKPKTPVLIIPGILGSELVSPTNTKLWPDVPLAAISDDGFLDQLMMDNSGAPLYSITVGDIVRTVPYGIGSFNYSSGLISLLLQQGYAENTNLFVLPYDWRKDPDQLEGAISTELDHIAALNPQSPKIDIIAHSYGGLVLKDYISKTEDPRIGKIIFVGVPQLGAPEAAQALIFGDDLGLLIINNQEIYKIAQNMPMIYDLLPSAEYYQHTSGFFDDLSNIQSPTMMSYDTAKEMLVDMGKNLGLLNEAELNHTSAKDNMDFSTLPYQVFSLVGCGEFTEKTIDKMYQGDPTPITRARWGPKYRVLGDSGDGTVPLVSAIHDGGAIWYISGVKHSSLLSDPSAAAAIASFLAGTIPIGLSQVAGTQCSVNGKLLSFSSNVNVTITDHATGHVLQPRQDYGVITTGNDRHIFIPQSDLANYEVNVQNAVVGNTLENLSVQNVNSTAAATTTYNYNGMDVGTANLEMNFPADNPDGQSLTSVNDTTGEVSSIPPSNQQDGSYGDGADSTTTGTDNSTTNSGATTTPPPSNQTQTYQPPPSSETTYGNTTTTPSDDPSQVTDNYGNPGSLQMPSSDSSSQGPADNSTPESPASDDNQGSDNQDDSQPAIVSASGSQPSTVNVTVNLPGDNGQSKSDSRTDNSTDSQASFDIHSVSSGQTLVVSDNNPFLNAINEFISLITNMLF